MRKMRLLTVLAAMLLSCGFANAQTEGQTGGQIGDLFMRNGEKWGDVNNDDKVDAADITILANIIMGKYENIDDYFYLGTVEPTRDNCNTLEGVVTTYESIEDALAAKPTLAIQNDGHCYLLCPSSWVTSALVLQNEENNGIFYELIAPQQEETNISGYTLFKTIDIRNGGTYILKTKAAAEEYQRSLPQYFYLGTVEPTRDNYTTLEGVVTTYESIEDALEAKLTLAIQNDGHGYLLCPSGWVTSSMALQNEENNGTFYELNAITRTPEQELTDIYGYALFLTDEIENGGTYILKTKAAAEEYKRSLNPQYVWLGNTYPTKNTISMNIGTEVEGLFTNCTSLGDAMEKASRDYKAGEYAVVLYPYSWGTIESLILNDQLVFLDSANKKYYATKQKTVSDFPDYLYYESTEKIGTNTTIKLSTKLSAEEAGATLYEKETPVNPDPVNPDPVNPDPVVVPGQPEYVGGSGITFVIKNNCGYEARFTGKAKINLSKNPNSWAEFKEVDANFHGPQSGTSWDRNDIIIGVGESKTLTIPSISYVSSVTNKVSHIESKYQNADFADGTWYFMNSDCDYNQYVHSIYLYTRMYSRSRGETGGSNHMYTAVPLKNTKLQRGYKYYLELNWKNPEASLAPDMTGSKYIILEKNKTGL